MPRKRTSKKRRKKAETALTPAVLVEKVLATAAKSMTVPFIAGAQSAAGLEGEENNVSNPNWGLPHGHEIFVTPPDRIDMLGEELFDLLRSATDERRRIQSGFHIDGGEGRVFS